MEDFEKIAFLFSRMDLNNLSHQRLNKHFCELNFRECLVIREIRGSLIMHAKVSTYTVLCKNGLERSTKPAVFVQHPTCLLGHNKVEVSIIGISNILCILQFYN